MTFHQTNKILCVRIDRIGDLVLTLPVDYHASSYKVSWLINKGMGFLCEYSQPKREYREFDRAFSFKRLNNLTVWFKQEKFSHIIFFHAPWWMTFAAWLSGIPQRAGRKSQWHSFLFLNKGFRQSRMLGEQSELDYNRELMSRSLEAFRLPEHKEAVTLQLQAGKVSLLEHYDLKPQSYVVVHAGMAGSARNWTTAQYASLVFRLTKKTRVVMTGTQADSNWLTPLRSELRKYALSDQILWLDEKLSLTELLTVLNYASAVVAPSTGVVHLAASLGVRTVGIYSPVKSQNVVRWGPKGKNISTLTPQVDCPGIKKCIGPSCPIYDCMELITVESVINELNI